MAGDLSLLPVITLEPIGSGDRSDARLTACSAPTPSNLEPFEPQLFALAWFIVAGDDRAAAQVLRTVRDRFASTAYAVSDPLAHALSLLVPRACRFGRRSAPTPTGDAKLDAMFTASARARAAIALCDGLGLDEATAGRVLGCQPFRLRLLSPTRARSRSLPRRIRRRARPIRR